MEKQKVLRVVSVCVALGNRHATRMRHISSLTCTALQYFSTISYKRHDSQKKVTDYKMRILISSTTVV